MNDYKDIVKSTGIIGLVQIFKITFGLVQNKVMAILIGTTGYGIYSLFYTLSTMISSFSTLGIDQAGVRQIAKNSRDENFGETIWTFKFLLFLLSVIAFIIILFLRNIISESLFGNSEYAIGILIVGFAILLNGITQGYISILNGLRRLKYIAYSQILGSAAGAIFALVFIVFMKSRGIPFFILSISIITITTTIFFVRKLHLPSKRPNFGTFKKETKILFEIGLGLAYSAIIVSVSSYFSQVYIRRTFGLEWVGMYNASNTLSSVYVGVILTAMGVDLMPRLAKAIDNDIETNKMVNNQMEFGLLVASVGIIGIIAFAPLMLSTLYSSAFTPAKDIMQWHILAVALRVISYPLGYVMIVRKQTMKYILVQTLLWGGSYAMLIILTKIWGKDALGANFLVTYIFYLVALYIFNRRLIKISRLSKKIFSIFVGFIIAACFINQLDISNTIKYLLNFVLIGFNIYWILDYLKNYMDINIKNFLA